MAVRPQTHPAAARHPSQEGMIQERFLESGQPEAHPRVWFQRLVQGPRPILPQKPLRMSLRHRTLQRFQPGARPLLIPSLEGWP